MLQEFCCSRVAGASTARVRHGESWALALTQQCSDMMKGPYLHSLQPQRIHPDAVALVFLWYASVIWSIILSNILWKKNHVSSPTSVLFRFLSQFDQPEIRALHALNAISLICHLWWSSPSSGRESTWGFCGNKCSVPRQVRRSTPAGGEEWLNLRWLWLCGSPMAAACLARGNVHHSLHPGVCGSNGMLLPKNWLHSMFSH